MHCDGLTAWVHACIYYVASKFMHGGCVNSMMILLCICQGGRKIDGREECEG